MEDITNDTLVLVETKFGSMVQLIKNKNHFIKSVMRVIDVNIELPTFTFYNSRRRFTVTESMQIVRDIYKLYEQDHSHIYDPIDVVRIA